jgi:hypothetical protein
MTYDLMKKAVEILIETVVPWVDQRATETLPGAPGERSGRRQMWIPRGVKEVER